MASPARETAARLAALRQALPGCLLRDHARLAGVLDRLMRRPAAADPREVERLETQLRASAAIVEARRASVPEVRYDDALPVHLRRAEIAATIARSPVTIVSGATGSGKSTQLPKICLELGRGVRGLIGHTQPRRIAAQALASRISAELGSTPGDLVGYQVRFVDRTSPRTLVKLMTDGLLLRELESDPGLLRYDTLIIDEAHERNLNVDFLLGVCRKLIQRRPDLRVIVTSATIETHRFADYFGGAPVVEVEGRSYAVDVRYRPLQEEDEEAPSLPEAVRGALEELESDAHGIRGDALVFLPGEKQINDVRDLLTRSQAGWDVLPLYARLTAPEQEKIFAPHEKRRVVLATNVAETSLTIPGVRFVIDAGLARVSRYSPRAKFQRLPIEPVSQASADQRKGRCGREGEGICIRLYSEEDFASRPRYTDPEILRTNLASLILQMAALGLGTPEDFPFLDAPDARLLNDGYRLLQELGAVDGDRRITRLGRQMAALPVDPRLARILVEAGRTGCLSEALVIASFLSIQDPRSRPVEQPEAADERHAQFADERSDFVGVLNLWRASREQAAASTRALRHWCKLNFLSYLRMREWSDLHDQLDDMTAAQNLSKRAEPAGTAVLHQTILTGFLGGIGVLDEGKVYLGARDTRFVIAPGTPLQKRPPRWVVAASLVETQRLYARMVAQVQPAWIESAGAHLVRRTYGEAEWDPVRGAARARETVSLYGRTLSSGRLVDFSTVDPLAARRMFVEEALVRRPPSLPYAFVERNERMRRRLEHVECCLRRRDLLASDDALTNFYLERVPESITSIRRFDRWWRAEEPRSPHLLDAPEEVFLSEPLPAVRREDYPDSLDVDGNELRMTYAYDATDVADGVTLDVPLPLLRVVPAERVEWLVPGWLRAKVIALLRGLPKDLRRELVPIPETADRFLETVREADGFGRGSLYEQLAVFATRQAGATVEASQLAAVELPPWLSVNLRILDAQGRPLRQGRDLLAVREALRARGAAGVDESVGHPWAREGLRHWDFGDMPASVSVRSGNLTLRMYPGIEDLESAVRLKLFPSADTARKRTRHGIVRLAALAAPQQREWVRRRLADDRDFSLLVAGAGFGKALIDEVADRAVEVAVLGPARSLPVTQAAFEAAVESGRGRVAEQGEEIARVVRAVLEGVRDVRVLLGELTGPVFDGVRHAAHSQLDDILGPGWVRETPDAWFAQLPKYLKALARRLERARGDVARDRRLQQQIEPYLAAGMQLLVSSDSDRATPELERFRWMIEEFRLSLFAQELRTMMPISAKRLDEQLLLARKEAGKR
jgi:ATP-dependent helicase HrpA